MPVLVPANGSSADVETLLSRVDGIILTGSRSNVQLGYAENWRAIWQKAAAFPGTAARAQLFEGHVVAVTTEDGLAQTTWYPPSRVNRYQTWALLGAGLLFAGLIELVFYWRSLF